MDDQIFGKLLISGAVCGLCLMLLTTVACAVQSDNDSEVLLSELAAPTPPSLTPLEELVLKNSPREAAAGYATYYASRFIGRKTTSGYRYHPDKMTAAHYTLPLGTVVKVVNPVNSQAVQVTINDRCAPKRFPFIDLSRAAAKRIGLWGKGIIKVVIIPLPEDTLEEPA